MYLIALLFGSFWFRGAFGVDTLLSKEFYNRPLIFHKKSIFISYVKFASKPSIIFSIQALNGYFIGKEIIHIIILPIATFFLNVVISIAIKELSPRMQWSFLLNPVVHTFVFSIFLIFITLYNIILFV